MSHNRMSEFRANRNSIMSHISSILPTRHSNDGNEGQTEMEKYFAALDGLERDIAGVNSGVDDLSALHGKLLSSSDGHKAEAIANQRDRRTAQINSQITKLKKELNAIDLMNDSTTLAPADEATRRSRHALLARRLMEVVDKYRTLERESQKRYRDRIERQIRLVKPDATDEEVEQAVHNESARSVFAMDVMTSFRSRQAKRMLRDVEQRDKDIREIGATIELLNSMFLDMQDMVNQQQEVLDNIENAVESAQEHTHKANQEVKEATRLRISARKKTWVILGLIFLVIVAIACGVAIPLAT
ncbi:t-SNARE [Linderina pennispora]|uniref:t-SNARE n=1 Tax=Linderina pennispora TaxID=61395 RepID=A0A1Y1WB44_9FUNG|nr:t-SNARE [Linderina pennispora]ORX70751.1 t-SNARE [Linderina pennispora]